MFITYTPDGEQPQEFEVRMGRVRASRAAILQKVYSKASGEKLTWEQLKIAVLQGDAVARRVILWHALTEVHATLKYEDAPDPMDDELLIENSRQELEQLREGLAKAPLDADTRAQAMAMLEEQAATAREDGGGKAPSTTSDGATG